MNVDRSRAAKIIDTPNAGQKLVTGKYSSGIFHKESEELKFHPGQIDPFPFDTDLVDVGVKNYLAKPQ
jgi:hypothetical protein